MANLLTCIEIAPKRSRRRCRLKKALTWRTGAEDGIRTHDPHLGKVVTFISVVSPTPLSCCPVQPVSTSSTHSVAATERSTNGSDSRRCSGGPP